MSAATHRSMEDLQAVNAELAALLHCAPAHVVQGASAALSDSLVVCGILGGKDVGKSTLINALAKSEVSVDRDEVGEGTRRPMAYVHESMRAALGERWRGEDGGPHFDVTTHAADAIRSLVLVDLPDFDSEFVDHVRLVERVAPFLDRVIWVMTPRKIADRAWVGVLRRVVKDLANTYCVLNKIDELMADADPFAGDSSATSTNGESKAAAFAADQSAWFRQALHAAGFDARDNARFLLAAAFPDESLFTNRVAELWDDPRWSTFSQDRRAVEEVGARSAQELNRLRAAVLSPVTQEEARAIKLANYDVERQTNVAVLRRHFDLDRITGQLRAACDPSYLDQLVGDHLGADYCHGVALALQSRMRTDRDLADELLERRIEHWPLLRLTYWPFGWVSRALGRLASAQSDSARLRDIEDPFDGEGIGLTRRLDGLRSRLLSDTAVAVKRLRLESEVPQAPTLAQAVVERARELAPELERTLLDETCPRDRKPSILARGFTWFVAAWFIILQPVAQGVLGIWSAGSSVDLAAGAYHVVTALSAPRLLAALGVVVGFNCALLAWFYAAGLRRLRRRAANRDTIAPISDAVADVLNREVLTPLVEPLHRKLERIDSLSNRLSLANE